jgi:hypothetical protein
MDEITDQQQLQPTSPSYRILNSGSLRELLNPISPERARSILQVQAVLKKSGLSSAAKKKSIDDSSSINLIQGMLRSETAVEEEPATGSLVVWAEQTDRIEVGCVLLNNWAQRAVLITSYDPATGAKGYELNSMTIAGRDEVAPAARDDSSFSYTWPPLALEMELVDQKWTLAAVSETVRNHEVFQCLPNEVRQSVSVAWELVFLLLLSRDDPGDAEIIQTLLDTGISPRKGLAAYMRLFQRVVDRDEVLSAVPSYRRIESADDSVGL